MFDSGRHYAVRELSIIIAIQIVLFAGMLVWKQSPGAFFAAGVISLVCILQGIVSLGEKPDARRNILSPSLLLRHRLPVSLVLACIAAAPLVYSLLSGKPASWEYDEFVHVNPNSVSTATVMYALEVCLLILLSRSSGVCELLKKGFPWQNVVRTIFLDVCFVCVLFFIIDSENADPTDPYIRIHNGLNGFFLVIFYYIAMSSAYVTVAFILLHERSTRTKLFSKREILLLEPCVILFFLNGITTEPGDMPFIVFTVFCPGVIFILCTLIGFFGMGSPNAAESKLPLSVQTMVCLAHLIAYATILAVQYRMVFLIVPNAMLCVWIVMSFFVGSLNKLTVFRKNVKAIGELNKSERGALWFDEKLRIYHAMKAQK